MSEKYKKYFEFVVAIILTFIVSMILYKFFRRRIIFVVSLIVIAGVVFAFFYENIFKRIAYYVLKFRWLLALVVFLICILFQIHGSSIAIYNNYFPTQTNAEQAADYYIMGKERQIRSDEWAVHTPTYFSQYYNDYKMESYQMSMSGTNMVLDYYAPVKDITIIGKPFSWGYILFGNETGLSWYWCSMMIIMFMSAFEMFMILTKKKVRLSVVGTFMIGLSPVLQWWFVPHITIVFIYAMGLFDIGYYFFTARATWFKWVTVFLASLAVIGFVLSIFPSCQLITALVVISLLIGCLIRDREDITFTAEQWYKIGVVVLVAGGTVGYYFWRHWNDLLMVINSVYPGNRVSMGGTDTLYDLFTDLSSMYLPYKDVSVKNNSEIASYIHFAPMFILLFPRISSLLKQKKDRNELVGKILFIILLFQIVFMCAGFSENMSKITLFKYVNRMKLSYGWTAVFFSIWSLDMVLKYKGIFKKWEMLLYPVIYGLVYCTFIDKTVLEYLPIQYELIEIVIFVMILIFAMIRSSKIMSYLIVGVMCVAGLAVNPLCKGTAPITNHPISGFIEDKVKEEPEAQWMTADSPFFIGNFVMANGAKVLGATNYYEDTGRWEILDPERKYEEIYNRYSNQSLSVVDEETTVDLTFVDSININVNPNDIKKMEVKYIVTPTDLHSILKKYDINEEVIFEQDGYRIYQLDY